MEHGELTIKKVSSTWQARKHKNKCFSPFKAFVRHVLAEEVLQLWGEGTEEQKLHEVGGDGARRVRARVAGQLRVHLQEYVLPALSNK